MPWADPNLPQDAQSTLSRMSASIFPNLHVIVVLLCVFPVTSCSAERSVSTLRRVKTYLRSTTGETRLSYLCLVSIFSDLPIDLEEIIDLFAAEKSRKMNFIHPTVRAETKNTPGMY